MTTKSRYAALNADYERNEQILRKHKLKISFAYGGIQRGTLVTEEGCKFPLYGIPAEKVDEVLEAFDWLREFHR